LSTTLNIVAIARDSALLRSLAFALQAHGYRVAPFSSWKAARESLAGAFCVILDGCLPVADREACLEAIGCGVGVVLLADEDTRYSARSELQVLQKPLSGADVLAAVTRYVGTRSGTTEFHG
jgi:DNA-binding NtrC family response regulator